MSEDGCHMCATLSTAAPEQIVYDKGPWSAFLTADVPGWVMLATKDHTEGMWSLSPDQAEGLGEAVQLIGAAVKETTGAERIHLVYLGDSALHFHVGFFPRPAGEPGLFDNSRLVATVGSEADPDQARTLGAGIRAAIER
jgi:diadenosine tetraphosphate (Ap4A) HIT family hydrolase